MFDRSVRVLTPTQFRIAVGLAGLGVGLLGAGAWVLVVVLPLAQLLGLGRVTIVAVALPAAVPITVGLLWCEQALRGQDSYSEQEGGL